MIKIENVDVVGWEHAIRGMRNPMNSWDKSDSEFNVSCRVCKSEHYRNKCDNCLYSDGNILLGNNDFDLMKRLVKAGTDHRKFMRMIVVYADVTAPMYWWAEYDTYKVGTVRNSCSKMHKIHSKELTLGDFSMDDFYYEDDEIGMCLSDMFKNVVTDCEFLRKRYVETGDKKYWRGLIQLLPESYNQRATVMLNYEVLANMYHSRKNHKLNEWHTFCDWIETLPHSELITGDTQ